MKHISIVGIMPTLLKPRQFERADQPSRKSLPLPLPSYQFIKPVRQDFVTNARLMPMTRVMILKLFGLNGKGGGLNTTVKALATQLGRSTRQVHRYLKDAMEEGYLYYHMRKDIRGYINGIRIYLNMAAIRTDEGLRKQRKAKIRRNSDMTHESDINGKPDIKREKTPEEIEFIERSNQILINNGIEPIPY